MPITPAMAPKMKYRVPISLWLVEKSHRTRFVIFFFVLKTFKPYQRGATKAGCWLIPFRGFNPGFDHVSRTISVHMAQDDSTYISRSEWDRVFSRLTVVTGLVKEAHIPTLLSPHPTSRWGPRCRLWLKLLFILGTDSLLHKPMPIPQKLPTLSPWGRWISYAFILN